VSIQVLKQFRFRPIGPKMYKWDKQDDVPKLLQYILTQRHAAQRPLLREST
jgi:hypothetical protein